MKFSYRVPKEVGKVGTESKTFIEPVSQRRDGIQAMFSRMNQNSPGKRKRSLSPPPPTLVPDEASQSVLEDGGTPSKKSKGGLKIVLKDDAVDSEIEQV